MPDLRVNSIKQDARLFLAAGPTNYLKLTLVFLAFLLGAQLLSGVASFATGLMIENAGGLSGLGTRVVLSSVDAIIRFAVTLLIPFWAMGFTHCAIGLARQDPMEPQHLTEGFYRFFVIIRLALCQSFVYMLTLYLASSISSTLFFLLPGSGNAIAMVEPYLANPDAVASMTQADATAFLGTMWPLLAIMAVSSAALLVPLFYGYRMCNYRVMDNERPGALLTIAQSRRMMKGTRWQLFKLDLSFWWYYGLQALISSITFVPRLPIPGMDANVLTLCCVAVQCAALFFLQYKCIFEV